MTRKTKKAAKEPVEEAEVEVTDPLAAAQAELGEVQEQLHRVAADFDNFRKRVERDRHFVADKTLWEYAQAARQGVRP